MMNHENRPRHANEPRYEIHVAARIVGVAPRTLRRYEQLGIFESEFSAPPRAPRYTDLELEQLRLVNRLIDDLGVNLAGADVILHMRRQLIALQRELDDLRRELDQRR
ncbi:MAG: MerR family transcriptional regulator [Thermomicrobiales bacterium]